MIAAVQLNRNCIAVESATDAYTATKTRVISTDIENEKEDDGKEDDSDYFNDNIIDCNF